MLLRIMCARFVILATVSNRDFVIKHVLYDGQNQRINFNGNR